MAKSLRKVVFEKVVTKEYVGEKCLTVDEAKKIIGWRAENDPKEVEAFGDDYKFRDKDGIKIRLDNCSTNRQFRMGLAMRYANEMLRNKWSYNGNRVVFDVRNDCHHGQHTLCGLILAEQIRKKDPKTWAEYGTKGPITIEIGAIWGISDDPSVIDTIDLGQGRSLGDVFYRDKRFENATDDEQSVLSKILQGAVRLAWLCMGGQTVTSAPKLFHSVGCDLVDDHDKILDAVSFIAREDGGSEKLIRSYISTGYAAALMYLMGTSKTKTEKYDNEGSSAIDSSLWKKAEEFWESVAQGVKLEKGDPVLVLRTFLKGASASAGAGRDEIVAAVKLAWIAFVEGKKLEGVKDLKAEYVTDKKSVKKSIVMPYMGGLDVKREMPPKPVKAPKPTKEEKAAAKAAEKAKQGGKVKGPKPLNAGGKGKGKKNTKNVSYPFKEGDEVHCTPNGTDPDTKKPWPTYTARVAKIADDGKVTVAVGKDEFELSPAEGDKISLEAAA